jgi:TRAP-type transport system large permease protein
MIASVILVFFLLLLIGFDVGFAMIAAALFGMLLGSSAAIIDPVVIPMTLVSGVDTAALLTVPLFVLAGEAMNRGGVTLRLVEWSSAMVGHFRGSLSQVAIMTNFIMAGVSGSAVADAAATGGLLIPAMKKEGYKDGYSSAVIAAGAMLGPIIPPSIPMIVYAVMANLSIIRLFMAGVVPGLMLGIGYMVICAIIARRRGYAARPRSTWRERVRATRLSIWALAIPILIIAGIRSGILTDTEAAGVIGLYALIVGLAVYRAIGTRDLLPLFYAAGRSSAIVLFLLAAAGPFTWLMSETRIPQLISGTILSLSSDPVVVLLIVNALLLLVGMILEPLPALVMFVPTLLPIQAQLGIDPIHFAAVVVINLMIGMLHPPVGLLIFVVSAIGKESMWRIAMELLPFLAWSLAVLVLITLFPPLVTWLPSLAL